MMLRNRQNTSGLPDSGGFPSKFRTIGNRISLLAIGTLVSLALPSLTIAQDQRNGTDSSLDQKGDSNSLIKRFFLGEQEPDDKPARQVPPPLTEYMGRRIAQTMHFTGAEWLIRDVREREERCSLMLANLGVKPGMTVCDMGCGNGFYSLPIAKRLEDSGQVFGVDVQPEMLGFLRERMEEQGVENIVPILGSYHNPHLPRNSVDLVLMVDVYHEFSHPEQMLTAIRESLKPGGQVVLVEYRMEDPEVPIKLLHKMSKAQVNKELEANGFKLVREFDGLPWQHMMCFGRVDDATFSAQADAIPEADARAAELQQTIEGLLEDIQGDSLAAFLKSAMPAELQKELIDEGRWERTVENFRERKAPELIKILSAIDPATAKFTDDGLTATFENEPRPLVFKKIAGQWKLQN